ncbi:MAG: NADH-quinone oxidoreductase subunit M [Desulfuromonadales bacterium]|nr:NADH-quinone oxidoreductase subunit M [Desulfuromonadales bacterium]
MSEIMNVELLIALPFIGAFLVAFLPATGSRLLSLLVTLATLSVAGNIFATFDGTNSADFTLNIPWMNDLGVNLHLAVDGLNLYLLLLTTLIFAVVLVCSWTTAACRRPLFLTLLLFLEAGLVGTFLSQNLILFFIFWEAVLIPMFIMILVFGGAKSKSAAFTFFLYTLAGSVLLLAAIILLGVVSWQQTGVWSFEYNDILNLQLNWEMQLFVFTAIVLACAIKCPLFPLHSWLPLAYSESPAAGTAIMAGALSKMGAFALIKLAVPLCPQVAVFAAPWLLVWAVISILYGAIMALRQTDIKLLVAYSSLSHMGYIVLGVFSFYETALHGALFQTFSHGLAVGGLFLLLGLLEQRLGDDYKNVTALSTAAPRFAVLLLLFILTSIALPLTSGFTGEFMILLGAFQKAFALWQGQAGATSLVAVLFACSGIVLGAGYMLRFARKILYGKSRQEMILPDLGLRETLVFVPLLFLILWVGIAPAGYMAKVQPAVTFVAERVDSTPASIDLSLATVLHGDANGR